MQLILIINTACCLIMTGIIWLIQIVHYPTFSKFSTSDFTSFHQFHTQSISFVVMPVMIVELFTAFYLSYQKTNYTISIQIALGLLLLIWFSTFMLQVPAHNALSGGFNEITFKKLLYTNWIRTLAWSFRSIVLCYIILSLLMK